MNAIEKQRPVVNYFSLNLGWAKRRDWVRSRAGIVGAYVTEEVAGLQGAVCFMQYSGGWFRGAQASFGANIIRGDGFGAQLARSMLPLRTSRVCKRRR